MPQRLLLRNGILALPGGPMRGDLLADSGRIIAIGRDIEDESAQLFDATGLTLGPGFVDIHVHGGGGHSFFTEDSGRIASYSRWAPSRGVTSFLISSIGRDADHTTAILGSLVAAIGAREGAEALGFHLEGPFINPERRGAFDIGMLRPPSQEEFALHQEAARGLIRQVTIAPELPGALDVVAGALATGCVPAMGHTDATVAQAAAAFDAGVSHVTHLFNAMRPIHQREGGAAVAALLDERVTCELIFDGAHVAPDVLRMAFRVAGPARTVVVTDNLHLAGTGADTGTFGGREVAVAGETAVRDDGTIVGSVSTMDQHFRNVVEFLGVDLATAFRLCSTNPAKVAGSARRKGNLEHGMDADIVLLDTDYRVAATVCAGELAYRREG